MRGQSSIPNEEFDEFLAFTYAARRSESRVADSGVMSLDTDVASLSFGQTDVADVCPSSPAKLTPSSRSSTIGEMNEMGELRGWDNAIDSDWILWLRVRCTWI